MLSVVLVESGHPNAGADGHNLKAADLTAAWEEVQQLVAEGWLQRAPEEQLADTEVPNIDTKNQVETTMAG